MNWIDINIDLPDLSGPYWVIGRHESGHEVLTIARWNHRNKSWNTRLKVLRWSAIMEDEVTIPRQ